MPAKFWDHEKGEVKFEAWSKSTSELETRMRTTGLPPKDAGEYKAPEVPKALAEAGVTLSEKETGEFKALAHQLGLTQKQYEGVVGAYFNSMEKVGLAALNVGKATMANELKAFYKTEEAMGEALSQAFKVINAYGSPEEIEAAMGAKGNVPLWVTSLLAKVGRELGEDKGVNPEEVLEGDSLEHLMRGAPGKEDAPYWNAEHPLHKITVAKVNRYHEANAAARQRKAA